MPCRICYGDRKSIRTNFDISSFELRDVRSYKEDVSSLMEQGISNAERKRRSMSTGLNGSSRFRKLEDNFQPTKQLPDDFMHVFLEGLVKHESRLFIDYCNKEEPHYDLDVINSKIKNFDYNHLQKPSSIDSEHLSKGLKQSASQVLSLCVSLPFLVEGGENMKDISRLQNIILLNQILNVCLAFEIKEEDVNWLDGALKLHNEKLVELYPDYIIPPKGHFALHIPQHIREFGNIRLAWCMRYEALHSHFKTLARIMRNLKNLPWSMCYRFQTLRCAEMMDVCNEIPKKFLYTGDIVHPGKMVQVTTLHPQEKISRLVEGRETVLVSWKVLVNGASYIQDSSVILLEFNSGELPVLQSTSVFSQKKIATQ